MDQFNNIRIPPLKLLKNHRLWKLLALVCVFAVLVTLGSRWGFVQKASPSLAKEGAPQKPQGWGDDGIKEVGVEWINDFPGTADDRDHWDESCDGLYYGLTDVGWTGRFRWTDWNAWETDFKLASQGGQEDSYVDNVDIAMICTHGSGAYDSFWGQNLSSVYFGSSHTDQDLSPGEAYRAYGDKDLEYLAFDSCSVLSDGGPAPYYNRGYWSTVMNGLHLLLGFKNTMYVWAPGDGMYWAFFMKGIPIFLPAQTVTQAWFSAVDYNQPTITCARVIAETSSNFSDYLHGYGYVSPDPTVDGWYSYWDHCSTGAKKLDLVDYRTSQPVLAVPVVQVLPRQIDESYVRNRIARSFDITGTLGSDDMFFYLVDTNGGITRTLQVDRITGSFNFRNWAELWVPPVNPPVLPPAEVALSMADSFFRQMGEGLPGVWQRGNFMYNTEDLVEETKFTPGGSSAQEISRTPADGMLTYDRNLNVPVLTAAGIQQAIYPIVGPGGRLKVYFGDGGEIIGMMGGTRDVEILTSTVEVMSAEQAFTMFLNDRRLAIPEVPWVANAISYTTAALGYYEMPYLTHQTQLIPVWIFNANFFGPNKALLAGDVPVYVPAAAEFLPPEVSITEPISGSLFLPGQPINFNGIVLGGTPPYTFKWSSSVDGPLGDTLPLIAKLSGAPKGTDLYHAIMLKVTDSNGLVGTATVYVKIQARVFLPPIFKVTP